jgi:hypothetical protein
MNGLVPLNVLFWATARISVVDDSMATIAAPFGSASTATCAAA